jgi:hypothetical protein
MYIDVALASRSSRRDAVERDAPVLGGIVLEDTLAHEKIRVLHATMRTQAGKTLLQPDVLASIMRLRGMHAGREVRYAEAFSTRTVFHAPALEAAAERPRLVAVPEDGLPVLAATAGGA